jgi:putative FmdB family regulatory protein
MSVKHFRCEDCGHEFDELEVDIEEEPLACPDCGGLDVGLLSEAEAYPPET